ncbi:MAG: phytanoyl-CoA dioxygenase family protein [Gammaproteobacteria bacterium]|nr:phytanoyl-CoA dioxygenase family protein [Gammaproteobacteria bacterium]
MTFNISEQAIESYQRDGAVCVRGLFDSKWLDMLATGVAKDIEHPGPLHTIQQGPDDPGFFLTDFCLSQGLQEFRAFITNSPAAEIAAQMMGASRINFFYDAIWIKGKYTPKRTRWHQDQPYYPVDGNQFCAIWLPLDPVTKETCLELVRGSHRWNRWFAPELTKHGKDLYHTENSSFDRVPDIEASRSQFDIVSWDMQPGDCIVFHALTLHGAPGNSSHQRWRRAISTFWMGDDAVFAERPGDVRPLFEGHGLKAGDPMDCDYFPRIWPRTSGHDSSQALRFTDPEFRISV